MLIKNLVDEDFVNYRKVSMFIGCHSCTFKCDKMCGKQVCQNSALAIAPDIEVSIDRLVQRYLGNIYSQAVVFGGLEPFDDYDNLMAFITELRKHSSDDIVIYTGYTKDEINSLFPSFIIKMKETENIVVKFGRFIPDQKPHYDEVLGVNLQSDNQYAERIS